MADEQRTEFQLLGKGLRAARAWLGLSRKEAAYGCGVGISTLQAAEAGDASIGSVEVIGAHYREAGVAIVRLDDGSWFIGDVDYARNLQ